MEKLQSASEITLLEQSHQAFSFDHYRQVLVDREADVLNGLIVTDSKSELEPYKLLDLHDLACDKAKSLISKKRKSLRRQAPKQIAE